MGMRGARGSSSAGPIRIGRNVWIGGGAHPVARSRRRRRRDHRLGQRGDPRCRAGRHGDGQPGPSQGTSSLTRARAESRTSCLSRGRATGTARRRSASRTRFRLPRERRVRCGSLRLTLQRTFTAPASDAFVLARFAGAPCPRAVVARTRSDACVRMSCPYGAA